MQSNREKVSYCIGFQAGKSIKAQFKDLDTNLVVQGYTDAIADKTPSLPEDEIRKILQTLQKQVQEQQKAMVEQ